MSYGSRLIDYTPIDLNNFEDIRLSEAGELEVRPYFNNDIYIKLGNSLLELSRVELATERTVFDESAQQAFVLRNLSSAGPSEAILIDDSLNETTGPAASQLGKYVVHTGKNVIIGTDPETALDLDLSEDVSERHLQIRIGNLARNIHFADLGDTSGTTVYIHQDDTRAIGTPNRVFRIDGDTFQTVRGIEQKWRR
jgi:hypothetical protein